MPSGAKKRKAAKKKKENQPNNHANPPSTHALHRNDVKHHEDQENDVGEISSPLSREHGSQQNLLAGVQVNREIKVEDASNSKNGKIKISELTMDSNNGGLVKSSSSSSSDDESRVLKNSSVPLIDSMKADDSISETLAKKNHSFVKEAHDSVVQIPSVEKMKESVDLSSSGDNSVSSCEVGSQSDKNAVISVEDKIACERKVDGAVIQSVGNTTVISNPKESVLPQNDGRSTLLYNGVKCAKDSGVTEPLLNPILQPDEQKTSWKSCCGLFDLFAGSGK